MHIRHLGQSGLRLAWDGAAICVDPPAPEPDPAVITWSETERVAGAREGVLAAPEVLRWLGLRGPALREGESDHGGFHIRAVTYAPIPWATPEEAVRKTLIGLRSPGLAVRRLSRTLFRPSDSPFALSLERGGRRIALLGQALHRFQPPAAVDRLLATFGGADVLVAGTDYDDEAATAALMERFDARVLVLADLIGPVRRKLGLPVRPLDAFASPRARLLREGGEISVPAAPVHPE